MNPNNTPRETSDKAIVPRAFTVKDAATAYAISRSGLYLLIKAGKLRDRKVGGRRLILAADLDAVLGLGEG